MNKTLFPRVLIAAGVAAAAGAANAVGPDFSTLTTAVDVTSIGVGVLALGAIMMGPKVIVYGVRKILAFFRG
jgi:hypothetical protein